MSKIIAKIVSVFLSLSIMLTSTGITLHQNFCKITGQKKVSLLINQKNDCCIKTKHHSKTQSCKLHHHKRKHLKCNHLQKENDCCNYEFSYLKIDLNSHFQKDTKITFLQVFLPNSVFTFFQENLYTNTHKSFLFYSDSSPPLSGREHIILKQSFLL